MSDQDAIAVISRETARIATVGGNNHPDVSRSVSITHARLTRLGVTADLFEANREPLPEALLLQAVIERAIEDAISRPEGSYQHRKNRREARKWLWKRGQKQHGYGWAAALVGWGEFEIEAVHRFVFPDGALGC